MPFDLKQVLDERQGENFSLHSKYINPQLPRVLGTLGFARFYDKGEGCYLSTTRAIGTSTCSPGSACSRSAGDIPAVVGALHDALDADLPNLVQMDCALLPACSPKQLVARAHPGIERVFFTNSGAEAIESAIKFARGRDQAHAGSSTATTRFTGSPPVRSPSTAASEFRSGFGPLLPGCDMVPFGDVAALARELRRGDVAAFIVEPIQGKGVNMAPDEILGRQPRSCAGGTRPCSSSTRCRREWAGTGKFFCHEHSASSPTSSRCPRRSPAGSFPSGRCSARRRSPTASTAPSIGPSSTRRPSVPTSWRWWPAWRRSRPSMTRTSSTARGEPERRS